MYSMYVYMYILYMNYIYVLVHVYTCMYVCVFVKLLFVNLNRFIFVYLMNVTMNVCM
jgi:hypothetical protein